MKRILSTLVGVVAGLILGSGVAALASRDSGGNYSRPAGNPVVTGTTISSSWANTLSADIASEMTNSLDRLGRGGMLAPFRGTDGTVSAPAMSFTSEVGSGLYRVGSGTVGMSISGGQVERWTSTGAVVTGSVTATGGAGVGGGIFTGGSGAAGVTATGGTGSANGVAGQGTGGGAGGSFTAGATGAGVVGIGGATSGSGGYLTGTTNSPGVTAVGAGSGAGGAFTGGASAQGGIFLSGGGSAPVTGAINLVAQPTPSAPANGDLWYSSTSSAIWEQVGGASYALVGTSATSTATFLGAIAATGYSTNPAAKFAPATGYANINLVPQTTISSTNNGDVWTTTGGEMGAKLNGAVYKLATSRGTLVTSGTTGTATVLTGLTGCICTAQYSGAVAVGCLVSGTLLTATTSVAGVTVAYLCF